jgi:hypothetical protein
MSERHSPAAGEQREFARIDVSFRATLRPLDAERAAELGEQILGRPSVWAPANEPTLRELATGGAVDAPAVLAQAVLELCEQVVHLRGRLAEPAGAAGKRATLLQLSGGGGLFVCDLALEEDDLFELRLDDGEAPPIQALGRVIHRGGPPGARGFRFEAIHPRDHELLMRVIYRVQRQALRRGRRGPS